MRPVWILALAATGCRGLLGIDDVVVIDAAQPPDAPADCASWQPHGMDACAYPPAAPLVLSGQGFTYDTTSGALTGPTGTVLTSAFTFAPSDGPDVSVLSIQALTIAAGTTIHVIGTRPLIVLAWSTIAIDGALDASSGRVAGVVRFGAGANEGCTATSGTAGQDASDAGAGSGGGGGAGFQGQGGLAGIGGRVLAGGGAGGATIAAVLRGGCPGGSSGAAGPKAMTPAATIAPGGAGGGALRLIAREAITIGATGQVGGNGGGGNGAPALSVCGGGGGGAGGYLGFEAPHIRIDGTVTANGGGGGGGGGPGDAGNDGEDGALDVVAARGGAASTSGCGRPGGSGSSGATLEGQLGASFSGSCATTGGGGGGGGAAGYIVVDNAVLTAGSGAKISPPITPP